MTQHTLHMAQHTLQLKCKKHNETCGHSGGVKLSWVGGTLKLSWGGGSKLCLRVLLCIKHLFNHFIHLFLWSRASNHSDIVFFVIHSSVLSDIPNIIYKQNKTEHCAQALQLAYNYNTLACETLSTDKTTVPK